MDVVREPFDDRSEPDEQGMYEYIYVGVCYTFKEGPDELMFSWYRVEPEVASLKRPIEWWPDTHLSSLFLAALDYLRVEAGVTRVQLLDPSPPGRGFIPIAEAVAAGRAMGVVPGGH